MPAKSKQASTAQAAAAKTSAPTAADSRLNDESVREYLKDNGDFLQRHPDMLTHLHVSHASGSAVSLVEKQVSVLRERNIDMRHRLKTLTHNARENDKLYEQTRKLVLKLVEADSIEDLHRAFIDSMHNDFGVERASMILFGDSAHNRGCRVESLDSAKIEIGALLRSNKPVCGALRKEEIDYIFGRQAAVAKATAVPDTAEVGSAALMPLSNGEHLGLIAVGSSDANRYSRAMGTLFLSHIADVIVRLLPRLRFNEA